jgi:hypothetical protein
VVDAGVGENACGAGAEFGGVERDCELRCCCSHAGDMGFEIERGAVEDGDGFEEAVAQQQAAVIGGKRDRIAGRSPVEPGIAHGM